MPAAVIRYEGTPGRNPATDTHPIPGLFPPLRAGADRVVDDAVARAAGGTSGVQFAEYATGVFNGQRNPPILTWREVTDEEAAEIKAACAQAEHEADPRRAEHEAALARRQEADARKEAAAQPVTPPLAQPVAGTAQESPIPPSAPATGGNASDAMHSAQTHGHREAH